MGATEARGRAPGETVAVERRERKETAMMRRAYLLAVVSVLLPVGLASAQESYPIMEQVAQKVIQKYQTASCQQLAQQKQQPPTGQRAQMEQRALQLLRNDPQMRTAFLNRVAAPIANKLFECGMIP
jgi:ABC-type Fe2+-enterobactin transport system substrate-binding protein